MKHSKFIALLSLGISMFAYSQTGKVGVNTENPKEILDVNGTVRVGNLPLHDENIFNGAETKATPFKPAGFVAYNADGVLGKLNSPAIVIHGTNMADDVNTITLKTASFGSRDYIYEYVRQPIKTISFTLETRSLVSFSTQISVKNVRYKGGNSDKDIITDGAAKRVGMLISLQKEGQATTRKVIMKDTRMYSQGSTVGIQTNPAFTVQGTFYLNAATQLMLDAGRYEFVVDGTLFSTQTTGLSASFGEETEDYINITAMPAEQ